MSIAERREYSHFNISGFIFGPFYYLSKGMWRKSISLFALSIAIAFTTAFMLALLEFSIPKALAAGVQW